MGWKKKCEFKPAGANTAISLRKATAAGLGTAPLPAPSPEWICVPACWCRCRRITVRRARPECAVSSRRHLPTWRVSAFIDW